MKQLIVLYLIGFILIVFLAIQIYIERYKYKDCLKVGHTKTYCILMIGK